MGCTGCPLVMTIIREFQYVLIRSSVCPVFLILPTLSLHVAYDVQKHSRHGTLFISAVLTILATIRLQQERFRLFSVIQKSSKRCLPKEMERKDTQIVEA